MHNIEEGILAQDADILCCPKCKGELDFNGSSVDCLACYEIYPVVDGIPKLFWPNEWDDSKEDVTDKIKSFYEKNPFPDYDGFDNVGSLMEKAKKGVFAKLLDEQIPFKTRIIECGCGTGQLTNFLSVANRIVIGTDMCMNSLGMAQEFKNKNKLERAHFYQMNLFQPCFKPQSFDLVISNGVLHHTSDPFLGFKSISSLVRPNGYIIIGLYHKYSRISNDIRRLIFKATKNKFKFLDRRLINKNISLSKRNSWFQDQYKNPHETKHTAEEVVNWLDETGFEFIRSIPKTIPFESFNESENLFKPGRLGNWLERLMVNIGAIFVGSKEGFFL